MKRLEFSLFVTIAVDAGHNACEEIVHREAAYTYLSRVNDSDY